MKQSEFGLPSEYQEIPEYFDARNINNNAESNNPIVEPLLNAKEV
ncbi:MAG: hypothetical protein NWP61_05115 [Rickettsiaceae bacterium]|nr:hypothetical protein [Rickettsiaceae bacterium]